MSSTYDPPPTLLTKVWKDRSVSLDTPLRAAALNEFQDTTAADIRAVAQEAYDAAVRDAAGTGGGGGGAGINPRGAWATGATYAVGDVVIYGGTSYLRRTAGAGSAAPSADATNWQAFAPAKGVVGGTADYDATQTALGNAVKRQNHSGTQAASTISDFSEAVDDRAKDLLRDSTGALLAYDDATGSLFLPPSYGGNLDGGGPSDAPSRFFDAGVVA